MDRVIAAMQHHVQFGGCMGKTLIVGDIHLKATSVLLKVDAVLKRDPAITRIVITGDVCDEWGADDILLIDELAELEDWVEDKRASGIQVDVLLGNHDFQYLLGVAGPGTQMDMVGHVRASLEPLRLQVACEVDGFLVTHAGLTQTFADEWLDEPENTVQAADQLNALFTENGYTGWEALASCGVGRGGHEMPGPLWADKWELEEDPADGISQIVGHTPVVTACRADIPGFEDDVPEIWFCDTFSLRSDMVPIGDGSMLCVDEGTVSVIHP